MEAGPPLGSTTPPLMVARSRGLRLGGQRPQERGTGGSDESRGHSPPWVASQPGPASHRDGGWGALSPRGPPRNPVLHSHPRRSPGHLLPGFKRKG